MNTKTTEVFESSLSSDSQIINIGSYEVQICGLSILNQDQETHNLIYRIDNQINGKFYIGQHRTKNPLDDYMGSGYLLKQAFKKYGLSSFTKTFLYDFELRADMKHKERELVPLLSCNYYNPICYNLVPGGGGGFLRSDGTNIRLGCKDSEHTRKLKGLASQKRVHSIESKQKQREKMKGRKQSQDVIDARVRKIRGQKRTPEQRLRMSIAQKGKKISRSSVEKARKTKQLHGTTGAGKSNPMFGIRTLINIQTGEKLRVQVTECDFYIAHGFTFTNYKMAKRYITETLEFLYSILAVYNI